MSKLEHSLQGLPAHENRVSTRHGDEFLAGSRRVGELILWALYGIVSGELAGFGYDQRIDPGSGG
jgi:hypothetical protein